MNVEPPETLVIIESIVYKSNGFAIYCLIITFLRKMRYDLAWGMGHGAYLTFLITAISTSMLIHLARYSKSI